MNKIIVYEGTTEPLEDTLIDSTGAQVSLDSTYVMEFSVVKEESKTIIFYKSSTQVNQIAYDDPSHGHYQVFRTPEDTIGKAGNHVFTLKVTKNDTIFHVQQGSFIIKGANTP